MFYPQSAFFAGKLEPPGAKTPQGSDLTDNTTTLINLFGSGACPIDGRGGLVLRRAIEKMETDE
jgi:hypothetical protein